MNSSHGRHLVHRTDDVKQKASSGGIGTAKSAGNDWSKPWPTGQLAGLIFGIEQFARRAYRVPRLTGLWGVDVIWSPDGPVIKEINRRFQGTRL